MSEEVSLSSRVVMQRQNERQKVRLLIVLLTENVWHLAVVYICLRLLRSYCIAVAWCPVHRCRNVRRADKKSDQTDLLVFLLIESFGT